MNSNLIKLIALRLKSYNDLSNFLAISSTLLNSIDESFWINKLSLLGENPNFYQNLIDIGDKEEVYMHLINHEKLSYNLLVTVDQLINIDFDNENFIYDGMVEDVENYYLARGYKLPQGPLMVKYFLTHLKRKLNHSEIEFILSTLDVTLFEAARNSILDKKSISNLAFMFISYWDYQNETLKMQKNIDKVIQCLDWVYNTGYNITLDASNFLGDFIGPEDLDKRILKWFKQHKIKIDNL